MGRRPGVWGLRPLVQQQQPRDVEAEEYQQGQQHRLGAKGAEAPHYGQRPDENIKHDRRDVSGQAKLVSAGKTAKSPVAAIRPDWIAAIAAMTPAPPSATTKNDTRQKAEVSTSIKASALIMPQARIAAEYVT